MFLTFGSQHARQSRQALPCCGAGHVAAFVTTVDVLGQAPAGAWSIMGMENLTTKFFGALATCSWVHASRVGNQCCINIAALERVAIAARAAFNFLKLRSGFTFRSRQAVAPARHF
jgi:hypothetical protein